MVKRQSGFPRSTIGPKDAPFKASRLERKWYAAIKKEFQVKGIENHLEPESDYNHFLCSRFEAS